MSEVISGFLNDPDNSAYVTKSKVPFLWSSSEFRWRTSGYLLGSHENIPGFGIDMEN